MLHRIGSNAAKDRGKIMQRIENNAAQDWKQCGKGYRIILHRIGNNFSQEQCCTRKGAMLHRIANNAVQDWEQCWKEWENDAAQDKDKCCTG